MTGQPAAVLGPVLQVLVRRDAESASLHGVIQDLLHLVQLGLRDRGPLAGRDHPQHVAPQRREGDQAAHVHAQALPVEAVHVFRESLPVPAHSLTHGLQGNRLDAVHHAHVQVPVVGTGRRESESALANGQGGDSEPSGQGGVWVPVELGIIVGVQVYGARGDDAAAGVQLLGSPAVDASADHGHAAILDSNVGTNAGHSRPVDNGTPADYQVIFRHTSSSNKQNLIQFVSFGFKAV